MKDLSDKSKLSKQPDQTTPSSVPKERGRFHRWRWNFKYFMYCWGFRSFMPPKPRDSYYFGSKFKISETELRKCPPDKTYEQYEMELREKAYNEALNNWRHGEEYVVGDISLVEDIKYHKEAILEAFSVAKTTEEKIVLWIIVLSIVIPIVGTIVLVIWSIIDFCAPVGSSYKSPFGN
ncbi:MAG: hypothetical protein IKS97_11295 [Fibrobacter sp.]|nr:hypothetical protein [bacterium]MBR6455133.1 hypothetical protein [Fibrobacter sp.]